MSFCSSNEPSAALSGGDGTDSVGSGEFMLFGVRVKIDPMRKCVSMNNLSDYEPVGNVCNPIEKTVDELAKSEVDGSGSAGYVSADDAVPQSSKRIRERKRGVPWTEEEHKKFLIGLQKVGKGDWRGISKNYVKTRTPTQVASHAQKYFIRRNNVSCRRRRSSLFDITTDLVTEVPTKPGRNQQDNPALPVMPPTSAPVSVSSNTHGFSVAPFPVTAGPVLLSMQGGNHLEKSAILVHPILVHPPPTPSTMLDLNADPSSISLRLSLSSGQDQSSTRDTSFPVMSSLQNEDSRIAVA